MNWGFFGARTQACKSVWGGHFFLDGIFLRARRATRDIKLFDTIENPFLLVRGKPVGF